MKHRANTAPVMRKQPRSLSLLFIPAAFAAFFVFLLPLKFGTVTGAPTATMTYWSDLFSIVVSPWPAPVFPIFAAFFLFATCLTVKVRFRSVPLYIYLMLWCLLGFSSMLGMTVTGVPVNYALQFIPTILAYGAFAAAAAMLMDSETEDGRISGVLTAAVCTAFIFSLISAVDQYFTGFDMTIQAMADAGYAADNGKLIFMYKKLLEHRISADFSACNAYAGYVAAALPFTVAALWRAGAGITPQLPARLIFTIPVLAAGIFVLVKTGSRGGALAFCAGLFFVLLFLRHTKKVKIFLWSLIPLGIAAFAMLISLGRGGKSLLFRLDYIQGAFKLLADNLLTGSGWGGFLRGFMKLKMISDPESPVSPHNFPLAAGSQSGLLSFLLALALALFPLYFAAKRLNGLTLKDALDDKNIVLTAATAALAAITLDSMMELVLETPAAMSMMILFSAIVLKKTSPAPLENEKERHPSAMRAVLYSVCAAVLALTSIYGVKNLRFDMAVSALDEAVNVDFKKNTPAAPDEALNLFRKCDELLTSSSVQCSMMSEYAFAHGDISSSTAFTEEALRRDPLAPGLNYRKYVLLKNVPGRKAEALDALRRAQELSPKNELYREDAAK